MYIYIYIYIYIAEYFFRPDYLIQVVPNEWSKLCSFDLQWFCKDKGIIHFQKTYWV